jgi:hypothetical protein
MSADTRRLAAWIRSEVSRDSRCQHGLDSQCMLDTVKDGDWLTTIREAAHQADHSQAQLRQTVANARGALVSWTLIGDALGISRQAAQQRFKDLP